MALFAKETLWNGEESEGEIVIRVVSTRGEITFGQKEPLNGPFEFETEGKEVKVKIDKNDAKGEMEELKKKFEGVTDKVKNELRALAEGSKGIATTENEPQIPTPLEDEEDGATLFGEVVGGQGEVAITKEEEEIKARVRDVEEADQLKDRWNKLMDGIGNFFQRTRGYC